MSHTDFYYTRAVRELEEAFKGDLRVHLYSSYLLRMYSKGRFPGSQWTAWPLERKEVPIPQQEWALDPQEMDSMTGVVQGVDFNDIGRVNNNGGDDKSDIDSNNGDNNNDNDNDDNDNEDIDLDDGDEPPVTPRKYKWEIEVPPEIITFDKRKYPDPTDILKSEVNTIFKRKISQRIVENGMVDSIDIDFMAYPEELFTRIQSKLDQIMMHFESDDIDEKEKGMKIHDWREIYLADSKLVSKVNAVQNLDDVGLTVQEMEELQEIEPINEDADADVHGRNDILPILEKMFVDDAMAHLADYAEELKHLKGEIEIDEDEEDDDTSTEHNVISQKIQAFLTKEIIDNKLTTLGDFKINEETYLLDA